jgi:hypothetical protein
MKWTVLVMAGGLCLATAASGQESTETTETTTVMTLSDTDLKAPLFMDDAIPVPAGHADLRFRFEWSEDPDGDVDDIDDLDEAGEFVFGTSLYYGIADRAQLSVDLPFIVGDGSDKEGSARGFSGNGDVTVGLLYQVAEQADMIPAIALQTNARFRTGYRSSPLDMQFRLLMTNEYDSGIRSHINLSTETEAGDFGRWNWDSVIGADGPLCAGGAVRWVADYAHQNSEHNNGSNSNYLELGTEWNTDNGHTLGMMAQVGLDDHDQTSDFGARMMWVVPLSN